MFLFSVIVDDGTAQAYLQIEQDLFQRFLALPSHEWARVLETTKCEEIVYQRETHYNVQQSVSDGDVSVHTYVDICHFMMERVWVTL